MSTALTPDLEQFVAAEVSSGRFPTKDAVVMHALRQLLLDREDAILGIRAGLDDVAAGRVQPLSEAFDELRRDLNIADEA